MAHVLQEVVILQGVRGESEKFFFNGLQLNKSCNLSKARSVFLVLECKDISRGRCPYKLYVRRCPASPVHIIKFPANSNSIFNLNYKIPCNYMNNNTIFLLIILHRTFQSTRRLEITFTGWSQLIFSPSCSGLSSTGQWRSNSKCHWKLCTTKSVHS
jgi:hypothetical protein